jgi:hypothetical protein
MPFGQSGAYWALLGPEIELNRTLYDLEEASHRVRLTDYPEAESFAENILQPASEDQILKVFNGHRRITLDLPIACG